MISVAIIEDDKVTRESLESLIRSGEEFEFAGSFSDAESGLEFLGKNPVHIVLVDIHLPVMNGIECVWRLKSQHPEMQFIMCTIFQDDDSVFNALKAGATGYLLKNDNPGKIIDAIREVFDGGSPMTPQIARRVLESFKKPLVDNPLHLLTKRENEMLGLLVKGLRYKEIADKLFISAATVRTHIYNIYQKLHVQSRTDAINKVFGEKN
jgi:DNA-binding NarL/FixJ family response regulator